MTDHLFNSILLTGYISARDIISNKMPKDDKLAQEILSELADRCYMLTGIDPENVKRQ
ncbi:hypothetical protein FACS189499_01910 [Clostridia bacterium]|nr:hypothetical protein FACS189499_01910 [Clostridia bacterium]